MHTIEVRPWRLVALLGSVLVITAFVPHPELGQTLPQSLNSLVKAWQTPPNPAIDLSP